MDWSILFKAFAIAGHVGTWSAKALADGKVTIGEAAELATGICAILGIKAQIELPPPTKSLQPGGD